MRMRTVKTDSNKGRAAELNEDRRQEDCGLSTANYQRVRLLVRLIRLVCFIRLNSQVIGH
jgi:hypothetical protein